jgi:phosphoribosylformylglycinamidine cyclo-ligase
VPEIFQMIQKKGAVSAEEMYRTFNMGIGFVIILSPSQMPAFCGYMKEKKMKFFEIGEVIDRTRQKLVWCD